MALKIDIIGHGWVYYVCGHEGGGGGGMFIRRAKSVFGSGITGSDGFLGGCSGRLRGEKKMMMQILVTGRNIVKKKIQTRRVGRTGRRTKSSNNAYIPQPIYVLTRPGFIDRNLPSTTMDVGRFRLSITYM